MPFIKLNRIERRKVAVFFSCLTLAAFAWLFFALSNEYIYNLKTVVHYTNLPQNKAFSPLQSDTVTLQVEGTGWNLLFSKLRLGPEAIKVNLKSLAQKNYITFTEQLPNINRTFHTIQRVVSVMPDTLYFDFSSRSVKKIPVSLLYKIAFQPRFGISDSIKLSPSYVTVTGPIEDIAAIKKWNTDTVNAREIKTTISKRIALKRPSKNNITIYPSIIEVKVPVSEFTEKSIDLPVTIFNDNADVKLLPSKVKVTFLTSLTNYSDINRDDFEAGVDLNNWRKGYRQLPVILKKAPAFCKILKIEPRIIDFIIKE
ncbi:MAG TPA: CdaR family protein [Sphingobacteriaceae bacterium]|nr:CdaR family protein [Sphingobacteriaceae bacterium]